MHDILLLNPNTSTDTTAMMVAIAQSCAPQGYRVIGETAARGVPMILDAQRLRDAGDEVVASLKRRDGAFAGVVVSAFGDPGIDKVRALTDKPVVGICEASILEAAHGGRRFGIATVTPELVVPIAQSVSDLGVSERYTGIRLTREDPLALAADAAQLEASLAQAVKACIDLDGAEAVVIGGGPLGQAAIGLAARFSVPIIAPIPAAMRKLMTLLDSGM